MSGNELPPPGIDYKGVPHDNIFKEIHAANPGQTGHLGATWLKVRTSLQGFSNNLSGALNSERPEWSGSGAEQVFAHVTRVSQFADQSGSSGGNASMSTQQAADTDAAAQAAVPKPIPFDAGHELKDGLGKLLGGDPVGGISQLSNMDKKQQASHDAHQQAAEIAHQRAQTHYESGNIPMEFHDAPSLSGSSAAVQHHHASTGGHHPSPSAFDSSNSSTSASSATTAAPAGSAPGGAPSSVGGSAANIGSAPGSSGGNAGGGVAFGTPGSTSGGSGTTALPPAANAGPGATPGGGSIGGRLAGNINSPGSFSSGGPTSSVTPPSGGLGTSGSGTAFRSGGLGGSGGSFGGEMAAPGGFGGGGVRSQPSKFPGLNEEAAAAEEEEASSGRAGARLNDPALKPKPSAGGVPEEEGVGKGAPGGKAMPGAKAGAPGEAGARTANSAAGAKPGATPAGAGAGAGKGKKGEDDKDHKNTLAMTTDELVDGVEQQTDESGGARSVDEKGHTVTPDVIGPKVAPMKAAAERPAPAATSASSYSPPTSPQSAQADEEQSTSIAAPKDGKSEPTPFVVPMATPIPPERR